MNSQVTPHLLLVKPASFSVNPQTVASNSFQQNNRQEEPELAQLALVQFDQLVSRLRGANVDVVVHQDEPEPAKPDSIFPNNWVSFHEDGVVCIYPMLAPNRRQERDMRIVEALKDRGFLLGPKVSFTEAELHREFLEGTGSLVLDRVNRIAYACISPRTNQELVLEWCEVFDYKPVIFHAVHSLAGRKLAIYHTNVMLSVGENIAVLCSECIEDMQERNMVEDSLEKTGHQLIRISAEQMNDFAANILLVSNLQAERFWIMSQRAFQAFTNEQRVVLSAAAQIISCDLSAIEQAGGGSARCMLAEIFLPMK